MQEVAEELLQCPLIRSCLLLPVLLRLWSHKTWFFVLLVSSDWNRVFLVIWFGCCCFFFATMNTTAIKCRITSKSTCAPSFGHYRGFSYSSNSCLAGASAIDAYPPATYSLNSSPVLRPRSSTNVSTFSSWQLVPARNLTPACFCANSSSAPNLKPRIILHS